MSLLNSYICALDIGSSKVAAVVAQIKRSSIVNIFFDSIPSKGIKQGVIVDSIYLNECISKVLKNLKAKSGINIKYIYTNLSGQDIVTKHSRAIIPLTDRGNKVISLSDIERVNEQARILASSLEEEIIQQIPFSYTIDSATNILNPLGLYSHKLEVDLYLICAKLSSVQSLNRVVSQAGYEIKKLFFSGLATSKAVFSKDFQDGVDILCDIGSDITELLLFKDGLLFDIDILALGGDDITRELESILKIPFDLAEDVKRSYGVVGESMRITDDKEILVKKSSIYKPIKQKLVADIITTESKVICQAIKAAVEKKIDYRKVNNFVATGRTILMEGFLEMLENNLNISVKLGRITESDTETSVLDPLKSRYIQDIVSLVNKDNNLSEHKYLKYITCFGIIFETLPSNKPKILPIQQLPQAKNPIIKAINRLKEVYQEYF